MATYASITPPAGTDGIVYASAVTLTASEIDLLVPAVPIPVIYGEAMLAIVKLAVTGTPDTNSTFVVAQTDLGDGTWVDVAWCLWTGTTGSAVFMLAAGVAGALGVQNSRATGTAPGSSGANQMPLGGRVRFTGKAALVNGTAPAVVATVTYKILGLR